MSEDTKKDPEKSELTDEDLELVNGGVFTLNAWKSLSEREKVVAREKSVARLRIGKICSIEG